MWALAVQSSNLANFDETGTICSYTMRNNSYRQIMTTASAKNKAKQQGESQHKPLTMAEQADLHKLYQESVQNAEFELDFIETTFKEWTDRKPHSMREDFCGTALSSVEWVQRGKKNTAVGVDYEKSVLDWGRENNVTCPGCEHRKI